MHRTELFEWNVCQEALLYIVLFHMLLLADSKTAQYEPGTVCLSYLFPNLGIIHK